MLLGLTMIVLVIAFEILLLDTNKKIDLIMKDLGVERPEKRSKKCKNYSKNKM